MRHRGRLSSLVVGRHVLLTATLVMVLVAAGAANASSHRYVDAVHGNNQNAGTEDKPLKTMAATQAGDIVHILAWNSTLAHARWPTGRTYYSAKVHQYEITWTFDGEKQVGQFVNGDFWVIAPVTVASVDPPTTTEGSNTINGSQINPASEEQGYDERALNYKASLTIKYPHVMKAGESLLSTKSWGWSENQGADILGIVDGIAQRKLRSAAVLTVLASPPPDDAFRPPICGSAKPLFRERDIIYSRLLSGIVPDQWVARRSYSFEDWGVRPARNTAAYRDIADQMAEIIKRPWIEHCDEFRGRQLHPTHNQPNYYADNYDFMARIALLCCFDLEQIYGVPNYQSRRKLVIPLVQLGIDHYYTFTLVGGDRDRQMWPMIFAGYLLDNADFMNAPAAMVLKPPHYEQFYYRQEALSTIVSKVVPPDEFYHGFPVGYRVRAHESSEYEHLAVGPQYDRNAGGHATSDHGEWDLPNPLYDKGLHCCAGDKMEAYRGIHSRSTVGHTIAAKWYGLDGKWDHPAYFDYVELRYKGAGSGWTGSTFVDKAWEQYARTRRGVSAVADSYVMHVDSADNLMAVLDNDWVSAGGSMAISSVTQPTSGTVEIVENGTALSYTPNPGFTGDDSFTYTIVDAERRAASATVTIKVERPNRAPILAGIGNRSTEENQPLSFSIGATDADGDPITYSAVGLPSGASLTGQVFSWTPGFDQAGRYNVTFVADDGRVQVSEIVTIVVANVNRPPDLSEIGDRSVDEYNVLSFTVSALDPDGDALTFSAVGLPAGATLTGRTFTWTPDAGQTGSHEIAFTVTDGTLSATERITVMVVKTAPDDIPPTVARCAPDRDAIQVPLNNLVKLHITDAGVGVDPKSVSIAIDGSIVYRGNVETYTSESGRCSRWGTKNDYRFVYQADALFDFNRLVTVAVGAADMAGNVMATQVYTFTTEMRAFGGNVEVGGLQGPAASNRPVTTCDTAGNLWVAWHAGKEGGRDIYVAKRPADKDVFGPPARLTNDSHDQCYPDIAASANGCVYVVWQDDRYGHWDIFSSVCPDGLNFSRPERVTDLAGNETHPAVAVGSQSGNRVYVAWQDDRHGHQDIYMAGSDSAFAASVVSRITSDPADQSEPDVAVDGQDAVYVVWTDMRNGQADIYGAVSTDGAWTNVPIVTDTAGQMHCSVAAEPGGALLHLVWVDNGAGNEDVHYAWSNGLPASPVAGISIIDDTSGARQLQPSVICGGSHVFACWQDARNVGTYGADTDLYFAELSAAALRTNILVGDDGTNANQMEPAVGVDGLGQPYVVWTDDRHTATKIYYAGATFIDPVPLDSALIPALAGATIGTQAAQIAEPGDVSIVVPRGACPTDVRVTISRIVNSRVSPADCLGSYDFGPSGIDFDEPVTVTIPYRCADTGGRADPFWYDSLTGVLSQQGITDIETIVISPDLHALQFKTTHFTPYYLVAGGSDVQPSSGAGRCSVSTAGDGPPGRLLVPYGIIAVVMAILKHRDSREAQSLEGAR